MALNFKMDKVQKGAQKKDAFGIQRKGEIGRANAMSKLSIVEWI
jgi:hypothetical protein